MFKYICGVQSYVRHDITVSVKLMKVTSLCTHGGDLPYLLLNFEAYLSNNWNKHRLILL